MVAIGGASEIQCSTYHSSCLSPSVVSNYAGTRTMGRKLPFFVPSPPAPQKILHSTSMTDRIRRPLFAFFLLAILVSLSPAAGQNTGPELADEKLYSPTCSQYASDYTFDCYHDYQEVTSFLRAAAEAHPSLASLQSLGKSYQGREVWMMTITDPATGEPSSKPAVWVDGGIDADEVVSVEAALGVIHRLLESDSDRVRELLRTRTFYVVPMASPDANQLHHRTPIRPRDVSLRPWDDDGDGRKDEDPPEDLDGDDEILTMRKQTPDGNFVPDSTDSRLLRERKAGDDCPCYNVYLEGIDNDEDGHYQEDRYGGVDPNRNYPGNWSPGGTGGPFPASEKSIRAMLDFIAFHPEIAASQHLHSSGGVVLRPPSVEELTLPNADRELYLELSRLGLDVTGYDLASSVYDWHWPPGSGNQKSGQVWRDASGALHGGSRYPAPGGSIDGMYLNFGILAFANEIYSMGRDYDEDGTITEAEQLRYNDEEMDGFAFREFEPYDHPQLGTVEIGGWRKFGHNNPPPAELPSEVRKNVEFVFMQASHTPLLRVGEVQTTDLGDGVWRVKVDARNAGYQPTSLSIRRKQEAATPVRIHLEDVEVLSAETEQTLGTLEGHSRKTATWVVRGTSGDEFQVVLQHPNGGVDRATITLP